MNTLDDQIRQALSAEEQTAINEISEEASFWQMLALSLKGKQAWMMWYMWILGLLVFALGLYFLTRFFASDDIQLSLAWLLGIQTCLSFFIVIKVFGMLQLHKLELLQEIKRLELRLALDRSDAD